MLTESISVSVVSVSSAARALEAHTTRAEQNTKNFIDLMGSNDTPILRDGARRRRCAGSAAPATARLLLFVVAGGLRRGRFGCGPFHHLLDRLVDDPERFT